MKQDYVTSLLTGKFVTYKQKTSDGIINTQIFEPRGYNPHNTLGSIIKKNNWSRQECLDKLEMVPEAITDSIRALRTEVMVRDHKAIKEAKRAYKSFKTTNKFVNDRLSLINQIANSEPKFNVYLNINTKELYS